MFEVLLTAIAIAAPAGFTENLTIDARTAWVAGKPVAIFCANDDAAWSDYVASIGGTPENFGNGAASAFGYTPVIGGGVAYLAPTTCRVIQARLRKQRVDLPTLGAALDVLAVEGLHLRGVRDDAETACAAIRTLPAFLIARWGFRKNGPGLARAMYGARNYLARQPPQYHAAGC